MLPPSDIHPSGCPAHLRVRVFSLLLPSASHFLPVKPDAALQRPQRQQYQHDGQQNDK